VEAYADRGGLLQVPQPQLPGFLDVPDVAQAAELALMAKLK
jgi:hypothetical protein